MDDLTTRPADSRDMHMVHTMLRREFAEAPALVRAVPHGHQRSAGVAAHALLVVDLLRTHHESEDAVLWPTLLERCPDDVAPLVETMESQHDGLHHALADITDAAVHFGANGSSDAGEHLALALEALLEPLGEHLAAEEAGVLPLIDAHLTAAEWAAVGQKGLPEIPPDDVPVLFGMLLLEATDVERTLLSETVPTELFVQMQELGPTAYRAYKDDLLAAS